MENKVTRFPTFKVFKAWIELESEKSIKHLMTYNGGVCTDISLMYFANKKALTVN